MNRSWLCRLNIAAVLCALFALPAVATADGGTAVPATSAEMAEALKQFAAARPQRPLLTALKPGSRGPIIHKLQLRLAVLPSSGIFDAKTKRAVKRYQRRHGLKVDGIAGARTLTRLGIKHKIGAGIAVAPRTTFSAEQSVLAEIAQCESGGNPKLVSANGLHRGKYQFSLETWRAVGGLGDPIEATEAEQDLRAGQLYAREGRKPWPNC